MAVDLFGRHVETFGKSVDVFRELVGTLMGGETKPVEVPGLLDKGGQSPTVFGTPAEPTDPKKQEGLIARAVKALESIDAFFHDDMKKAKDYLDAAIGYYNDQKQKKEAHVDVPSGEPRMGEARALTDNTSMGKAIPPIVKAQAIADEPKIGGPVEQLSTVLANNAKKDKGDDTAAVLEENAKGDKTADSILRQIVVLLGNSASGIAGILSKLGGPLVVSDSVAHGLLRQLGVTLPVHDTIKDAEEAATAMATAGTKGDSLVTAAPISGKAVAVDTNKAADKDVAGVSGIEGLLRAFFSKSIRVHDKGTHGLLRRIKMVSPAQHAETSAGKAGAEATSAATPTTPTPPPKPPDTVGAAPMGGQPPESRADDIKKSTIEMDDYLKHQVNIRMLGIQERFYVDYPRQGAEWMQKISKMTDGYIQSLKQVVYQTQGITGEMEELQNQWLKIGKTVAITGQDRETMEKAYINTLKKGVKEQNVALKLSEAALHTATMIGVSADDTVDLFTEWHQLLGLNEGELADISRGIQEVARFTGITGENLMKAVKGSEQFLKQMSNAGTLTAQATRNIIELQANAQKFGAADAIKDLQKGFTSTAELMLNSSDLVKATLFRAAGSVGRINDLLNGQILKSKAGIRDMARGLENVLSQYGARTQEEFDKLAPHIQAQINLQLKASTGKDFGEMRSVIDALAASGKTYTERLEDINKQEQKNLTVAERATLAEERRRLQMSQTMNVLGGFDKAAKDANSLNDALGRFDAQRHDFQEDLQSTGQGASSNAEILRKSLTDAITQVNTKLTQTGNTKDVISPNRIEKALADATGKELRELTASITQAEQKGKVAEQAATDPNLKTKLALDLFHETFREKSLKIIDALNKMVGYEGKMLLIMTAKGVEAGTGVAKTYIEALRKHKLDTFQAKQEERKPGPMPKWYNPWSWFKTFIELPGGMGFGKKNPEDESASMADKASTVAKVATKAVASTAESALAAKGTEAATATPKSLMERAKGISEADSGRGMIVSDPKTHDLLRQLVGKGGIAKTSLPNKQVLSEKAGEATHNSKGLVEKLGEATQDVNAHLANKQGLTEKFSVATHGRKGLTGMLGEATQDVNAHLAANPVTKTEEILPQATGGITKTIQEGIQGMLPGLGQFGKTLLRFAPYAIAATAVLGGVINAFQAGAKAAEIFGVAQDKVTVSQKLSAESAGLWTGILNTLTFGIFRKALGPTGSWTKALAKLMDAFPPLMLATQFILFWFKLAWGVLKGLGLFVKEVFIGIWEGVMAILSPVVEATRWAISAFFDMFTVFGTLGGSAKDTASIVDVISGAFKALGKVIGFVFKAIGYVIGLLVKLVVMIVKPFIQAAFGIVKGIMAVFAPFYDMFFDLFRGISNILEGIFTLDFKKLGKGIIDLVMAIPRAFYLTIVAIFTKLPQFILQAFSDIFLAIGRMADGITGPIGAMLRFLLIPAKFLGFLLLAIARTLMHIYDIAAGLLTFDFKRVWEGIKGVFTEIPEMLWEAFKGIANILIEVLIGIPKWFVGMLMDAFVNFPTWLFNSIIDGLKGLVDNDWIGPIFEPILDFFKALKDLFNAIISPFAELGRVLMSIFDAVSPLTGDMDGGGVLGLLKTVIHGIAEVIGWFIRVALLPLRILIGAITLVVQALTFFMRPFVSFYSAICEIVSTFNSLVDAMVKPFKWLWDILVGHSIIPDLVLGIVKWFGMLPLKIMGGLLKLGFGITKFFLTLPFKIAGKLIGLGTSIVKKIGGGIFDAGKGLWSMFGKEYPAAQATVGKYFSWVADKWKVFKDLGWQALSWVSKKWQVVKQAAGGFFSWLGESLGLTSRATGGAKGVAAGGRVLEGAAAGTNTVAAGGRGLAQGAKGIQGARVGSGLARGVSTSSLATRLKGLPPPSTSSLATSGIKGETATTQTGKIITQATNKISELWKTFIKKGDEAFSGIISKNLPRLQAAGTKIGSFFKTYLPTFTKAGKFVFNTLSGWFSLMKPVGSSLLSLLKQPVWGKFTNSYFPTFTKAGKFVLNTFKTIGSGISSWLGRTANSATVGLNTIAKTGEVGKAANVGTKTPGVISRLSTWLGNVFKPAAAGGEATSGIVRAASTSSLATRMKGLTPNVTDKLSTANRIGRGGLAARTIGVPYKIPSMLEGAKDVAKPNSMWIKFTKNGEEAFTKIGDKWMRLGKDGTTVLSRWQAGWQSLRAAGSRILSGFANAFTGIGQVTNTIGDVGKIGSTTGKIDSVASKTPGMLSKLSSWLGDIFKPTAAVAEGGAAAGKIDSVASKTPGVFSKLSSWLGDIFKPTAAVAEGGAAAGKAGLLGNLIGKARPFLAKAGPFFRFLGLPIVQSTLSAYDMYTGWSEGGKADKEAGLSESGGNWMGMLTGGGYSQRGGVLSNFFGAEKGSTAESIWDVTGAAARGALHGASFGSWFGPWGIAIGGLIGAIVGGGAEWYKQLTRDNSHQSPAEIQQSPNMSNRQPEYTPLATGTPEIMNDQLAMVHKGEMIIPAQEATMLRGSMQKEAPFSQVTPQFGAMLGAGLTGGAGTGAMLGAGLTGGASTGATLGAGLTGGAGTGAMLGAGLAGGAGTGAMLGAGLAGGAGTGAMLGAGLAGGAGTGAMLGAGLTGGAGTGAMLGAGLTGGAGTGAMLGAGLTGGASTGAMLGAGLTGGASTGAMLGAGLAGGSGTGALLGAGLAGGAGTGAMLGAGLTGGAGTGAMLGAGLAGGAGTSAMLGSLFNTISPIGQLISGFTDIAKRSDIGIVGKMFNIIKTISPIGQLISGFTDIAKTNNTDNSTTDSATAPSYISTPGFAVGTPEIMNDQLAMVHKGEMIVPAQEATVLRASMQQNKQEATFGLGTGALLGAGLTGGLGTGALLGAGLTGGAGTGALLGAGLAGGSGTGALLGAGLTGGAGTGALLGAGLTGGAGTGALLGAGLTGGAGTGAMLGAGLAGGAGTGAMLGAGLTGGAGTGAMLGAGLAGGAGTGAMLGAGLAGGAGTGAMLGAGLTGGSGTGAMLGVGLTGGAGTGAMLGAGLAGGAGTGAMLGAGLAGGSGTGAMLGAGLTGGAGTGAMLGAGLTGGLTGGAGTGAMLGGLFNTISPIGQLISGFTDIAKRSDTGIVGKMFNIIKTISPIGQLISGFTDIAKTNNIDNVTTDSTTAPSYISTPGFAVGTPEIMNDQLAMVHEGEMIIPAREAAMLRASMQQNKQASAFSEVAPQLGTMMQSSQVSTGPIENIGLAGIGGTGIHGKSGLAGIGGDLSIAGNLNIAGGMAGLAGTTGAAGMDGTGSTGGTADFLTNSIGNALKDVADAGNDDITALNKSWKGMKKIGGKTMTSFNKSWKGMKNVGGKTLTSIDSSLGDIGYTGDDVMDSISGSLGDVSDVGHEELGSLDSSWKGMGLSGSKSISLLGRAFKKMLMTVGRIISIFTGQLSVPQSVSMDARTPVGLNDDIDNINFNPSAPNAPTEFAGGNWNPLNWFFATGTPEIMEDRLVNVHKGEMIVPAKESTLLRESLQHRRQERPFTQIAPQIGNMIQASQLSTRPEGVGSIGLAGIGLAGTGIGGTGVAGLAGTGIGGTGVAGLAGTGIGGTGVAGLAGTGIGGTGVAGLAGTGIGGTGVAGLAGTGIGGTGVAGLAGTGIGGTGVAGLAGTGIGGTGVAGLAGTGIGGTGVAGLAGTGIGGTGVAGLAGTGIGGTGVAGLAGTGIGGTGVAGLAGTGIGGTGVAGLAGTGIGGTGVAGLAGTGIGGTGVAGLAGTGIGGTGVAGLAGTGIGGTGVAGLAGTGIGGTGVAGLAGTGIGGTGVAGLAGTGIGGTGVAGLAGTGIGGTGVAGLAGTGGNNEMIDNLHSISLFGNIINSMVNGVLPAIKSMGAISFTQIKTVGGLLGGLITGIVGSGINEAVGGDNQLSKSMVSTNATSDMATVMSEIAKTAMSTNTSSGITNSEIVRPIATVKAEPVNVPSQNMDVRQQIMEERIKGKKDTNLIESKDLSDIADSSKTQVSKLDTIDDTLHELIRVLTPRTSSSNLPVGPASSRVSKIPTHSSPDYYEWQSGKHQQTAGLASVNVGQQ